jgi:hypothetical protein
MSLRWKSWARFGVLVLAGVAGAVVGAPPAQADRADCYSYPGTICLTEFVAWTGQVWRQYPWQIVGCRKLAPESFNNETTTAGNFTSASIGVYLYDRDDCTGTNVFLGSGAVRDFSSSTFNNKASSIRVVYF